MDVNQVLESTLSPEHPSDASTRQNAEQQLTHAAEVDFSGYLTTLAHELANEQAQPHIRTAAGIALKNAFSSREYARLREVQERWINQIDANVKKSVKDLALQTLGSRDGRAGQSAGQFVASIAAIEIPRNEWPELMAALVENVGQGGEHLKQASLTTIGYICETDDAQLRESLAGYSNQILTAVVQGARKEEENMEVRNAAITALSDCLDFIRSNFDNEGERNYIMQVVCEATQSGDVRIEAGAYGCLNRIMGLYYDKMSFYMEKALYGLTIIGMKNEEEDVGKLAVEFWCTVCEEEIAIEDDNQMAHSEGSGETRPYYHFAKTAAVEVVPALMQLMTRQDEDAADEDYNVSRAAYQCLQLFAQAVGSDIVPSVLAFVEANLADPDWHKRDAAVSAFGAIMEGPKEVQLEPLVKQALPLLMEKMRDDAVQVRDSAAYALGRICDLLPDAIDPQTELPALIEALFGGLSSNPKMAGSCCWALMNLADKFAGEPGCQHNALSPHFQGSATALLQVTEKSDVDNQLRMAAYEVLNNFITNAANDCLPVVAKLSDVIIQRLENTIPMQHQVVSVEDRITLEEIQTSLTSGLLAIIQRLEGEIKPQADRIMHILLQMLSSFGPKSSVPDAIFAAMGGLANALEEDFVKYMDSFVPFLYNALGNQDEPALCSMAIGLVSDITRSLSEKSQPYCDSFMNYLLNNLRSTSLSNQFKPAILQCFGDIAQAIGPYFETYLSVVATVLQQAANVNAGSDAYDLYDYVTSLREGIMDAWSGIILAMKQGKAQLLTPYVESIFQLLSIVAQDHHRSEPLARSAMGVIGDLADAFPHGDYVNYYRNEWIQQLIKETRQNREFSARTIETARWAREQVKRQTANFQGVQMS
ncbi:karyopherin beta [Xylographa bjoerkii]|nr:karyopherin beta [Xylographa bjoerkii]